MVSEYFWMFSEQITPSWQIWAMFKHHGAYGRSLLNLAYNSWDDKTDEATFFYFWGWWPWQNKSCWWKPIWTWGCMDILTYPQPIEPHFSWTNTSMQINLFVGKSTTIVKITNHDFKWWWTPESPRAWAVTGSRPSCCRNPSSAACASTCGWAHLRW